MHKYGLFQVAGKVDSSSGAVTAFYTRSSDDYNNENHGAFDEIDFEFLNGNPSVPSGLWLNSFHKGMSGGERLVKPAEYRRIAGLGDDQDASNTFITYTINWQPDQVLWYADSRTLLRRHYGENVSWTDMKGVSYARSYRPPTEPQHVTFSAWADLDQTRAFGGKLEWSRSPFTSQFKDLRRVLCDLPADSGPQAPAWVYRPTPAGHSNNASPTAELGKAAKVYTPAANKSANSKPSAAPNSQPKHKV